MERKKKRLLVIDIIFINLLIIGIIGFFLRKNSEKSEKKEMNIATAVAQQRVATTQWYGGTIKDGQIIGTIIDFRDQRSVIIKEIEAVRENLYDYDFDETTGKSRIFYQDRRSVLQMLEQTGEEALLHDANPPLGIFRWDGDSLYYRGTQFTKTDFERIRNMDRIMIPTLP